MPKLRASTEFLRIVPGSKHDVILLDVGVWRQNALPVFDLAYYQGWLFRQILDHGGNFRCRVKKDANFVILVAKKPRWVGLEHKVKCEPRPQSRREQQLTGAFDGTRQVLRR